MKPEELYKNFKKLKIELEAVEELAQRWHFDIYGKVRIWHDWKFDWLDDGLEVSRVDEDDSSSTIDKTFIAWNDFDNVPNFLERERAKIQVIKDAEAAKARANAEKVRQLDLAQKREEYIRLKALFEPMEVVV